MNKQEKPPIILPTKSEIEYALTSKYWWIWPILYLVIVVLMCLDKWVCHA